MIVRFIATLAVGVVAGVVTDGLMRGRNPRSVAVVAAGVAGAVAGLLIRMAVGPDDMVIEVLTALVGALATAFIVGARIFTK